MKIVYVYCDRCKIEIKAGRHDDVADFLKNEYPGRDICAKCDLLITLSKSLSSSDLINGWAPGTSARKMLDVYDSPVSGS